MRSIFAAAVLMLLLAFPAGAVTRATGLKGRVLKSPTRPVCREADPCSAPAKHVTVVFTRKGASNRRHQAQRTLRDHACAGGLRRTHLPVKFGFKPHAAKVVDGRVSVRNFTIDTGIR